MDIEIQVFETEDHRLVAAPRVPRGANVVWIFTGDLDGRDLRVQEKGGSRVFPKPAATNGASGSPFPTGSVANSFEYEILDEQGTPIPWAMGTRNGGCVKIPDPPRR